MLVREILKVIKTTFPKGALLPLSHSCRVDLPFRTSQISLEMSLSLDAIKRGRDVMIDSCSD